MHGRGPPHFRGFVADHVDIPWLVQHWQEHCNANRQQEYSTVDLNWNANGATGIAMCEQGMGALCATGVGLELQCDQTPLHWNVNGGQAHQYR